MAARGNLLVRLWCQLYLHSRSGILYLHPIGVISELGILQHYVNASFGSANTKIRAEEKLLAGTP